MLRWDSSCCNAEETHLRLASRKGMACVLAGVSSKNRGAAVVAKRVLQIQSYKSYKNFVRQYLKRTSPNMASAAHSCRRVVSRWQMSCCHYSHIIKYRNQFKFLSSRMCEVMLITYQSHASFSAVCIIVDEWSFLFFVLPVGTSNGMSCYYCTVDHGRLILKLRRGVGLQPSSPYTCDSRGL